MELKAYINEIDHELPVDALFYHLTDGAIKPGSLLYESQDAHGKFTGFSIAIIDSSISVSGRGDQFFFEALDELGEALLKDLKVRLPGEARILNDSNAELSGELKPDLSKVELHDRLSAVNHMDLVRSLLPDIEGDDVGLPLGLYGGFAYDFVRQFERVPNAQTNILHEEDYRFYLGTTLFIVDHGNQKTYFVSLKDQSGADELLSRCQTMPELKFSGVALGEFKSDTDRGEYLKNVEKLKDHIAAGDIFQVQYGRTQFADFSGDAFKVYTILKGLNPSPFMFYMCDKHGALFGATPELAVSVFSENQERRVKMTPIAGTKPRGIVDGKINPQLDQRYEISLQTDGKEIAEHVMLIDLGRNDIASIAKPGTTLVDESIVVKKFSHVQHLVSRVSGLLRDEVDALTAYLATMNMGTLTGAPKPMAMKLAAEFEKSERGYYGGGFGFLTYRGELETCIIIRSIRVKNDKVYLRASAGIVADSVPESEYLETENKMRSCKVALEEAVK